MQQLQISIPKPCHQDWNKMTPEERGRFCSSCHKTVLDFSDKTDDEILDFINSHRDENLCGRFRNDQLSRPMRIEVPLPVYRSQLSFINTFLLALLFCFGTSLFSCNIPDTVVTPPIGLIETQIIETQTKNVPDANDKTLMGDTIITAVYTEEPMTLTGEVVVDFPIQEDYAKGKIAVHPQVIDLPAAEIIDTVELATVDITASPVRLTDGNRMVGMVVVRTVIEDSWNKETDSSAVDMSEETNTIHEEGKTTPVNEQNFFTSVYPNPSEGFLNIEFLPDKEQYVQLDLFDAVGNLVRNFIPRQLLQPELQILKVDVSDQPPGIYFLRISTGDKVKTERVVIGGND